MSGLVRQSPTQQSATTDISQTYLGVDYGTRRVGVALSGAHSRISVPLTTLESRDDEHARRLLCQLALEHQVQHIVIGLPLNMDGSQSRIARQVLGFAKRLGKESELKITLWDERLTTVQAERTIGNADSQHIDALAASLLLQSYLDSL